MAKTTADFPSVESVTSTTEFLVRQGGNRRLPAIALDEYIRKLIPSEGLDGREIELRTTSTELQWRYVDSQVWNSLLQLSTLQGNDGKSVEMRVGPDHIQWRSGDGPWVNLLTLEDLTANAVPVGGTAGQVLAKSSNADGAVEWRTVKDGGVPEFRTTATNVEWRLVGDTTWNNLITLADLQSPGVPKGGTVGQVLVKGSSTDYNYAWQTPQTPQMQSTATHIQWKYTSEANWTNLVALTDITGKNVEFRTNATHMQWRVVGDSTWINLVALDTLKGSTGPGVPAGGSTGQVLAKASTGDFLTTWIDPPTGGGTGGGADGKNPEFQKTATHIQWRLVGSSTWIDLVPLSDITGADGKPVELQVSATHIQWRVVGTASWTNLIALSALKGTDGQGVPTGGTSGQILSKTSSTDFASQWIAVPNAPNGMPAGGTAGQLLIKSGVGDYTATWGAAPNAPNGVPTGGTSGQILAKSAATNYAMAWVAAPTPVPSGGTTGQVLAKTSATDYALSWVTPANASAQTPAGGTTGQILAKSADGDYAMAWINPPTGGGTANGIPAGGSTGQVLAKSSATDYAAAWVPAANASAVVPTGGTTGQVLTKSSATNYAMAWTAAPAAPNGVPAGGTAGQILSKASATDYALSWIAAPSGGGGGAGVDLTTDQTIKGIKTFSDYIIAGSLMRFINFDIKAGTVSAATIAMDPGAALVVYDIAAAGLAALEITLPSWVPSGYEFVLGLTGGTVTALTWKSGSIPWGTPMAWGGPASKTSAYQATRWRFNGNNQQWYQV